MGFPDYSFISDPNRVFGAQNQMFKLQQALANAQKMQQEQQLFPLQLQQQQLANQGSQAKLPYIGPQAKADLDYTNANANKINTMTPLEAQNQQNVNKWYGPKAQQEINESKALSNYRSMGGANLGTGGSEELFTQSLVKRDNPGLSDEQVYAARNAYAQGKTELPDGTPLNPMSPATQAALDRITKGTTTAQGLNQQRFARTTDALLDEGNKLMPVISQYSGALGKGKGGIDAVKSAFGENSPQYNQYVYFTRSVVPAAAGEMMRAFGVNASDEQKKLYMSVVNPFSWDQNPKAAMENYKRMTNMFKNVVSKQVAKSTSQIQTELRAGQKSYSDRSNNVSYSDEEIAAEAKRRGL